MSAILEFTSNEKVLNENRNTVDNDLIVADSPPEASEIPQESNDTAYDEINVVSFKRCFFRLQNNYNSAS